MGSRFWDSEANKFTLYGAIFGFLFPIIATIIQAISHNKEISWAAVVQVQTTDPLLWIIDSAPFFLGLFARFAGRRQDQLKKIILESSAADQLLDVKLEDARQFANGLTYLSGGLVAVVLVLGVLWLQSFIRSTVALLETANPPVVQPTILPTSSIIDDSPDSNPTTVAIIVVTATSTPTSVVIQPTATPAAIPTQSVNVVLAAAQVSPTILSPTSTPTTALNTKNSIRLGYMARDENCEFFTQVASLVWQQEQGIAVTVETFGSRDELYQALTSTADPHHIDLTLCFVDPDDRDYLVKYAGGMHVIGKTYWEQGPKKLLAMANPASPLLMNPDLACANRYIQKQDYTQLQITTSSAAAWIDANRLLVQSWLGCDTPPS